LFVKGWVNANVAEISRPNGLTTYSGIPACGK
jgi:hypothetical protein